MDLSPYRSWLLLLHVLAVFWFLMLHGISAGVAFRIRGERDRSRLQALLEFSNAYLGTMYGALTLVLVTGIVSGIAGAWWTSGRLWVWAAVVVLVLMGILMPLIATTWVDGIRHTLGIATATDARKRQPPPPPGSDADLATLLSSSRPWAILAIGVGGLVILAWLMVLKPF